MVLGSEKLCDEIKRGAQSNPGGIAIVPTPDTKLLEASGEASVSLRLGRWFQTFRQSSETHISVLAPDDTRENRIAKRYFAPFGASFVLHPGRFVLASTMEWVRLPKNYAAFVVGKSKLGRRGIVIETAAGVHPGFTGCLTLEIANVGEVPVKLVAGMLICQLFFHSVDGNMSASDTKLAGQRKPRLGQMGEDATLKKLRSAG